MAAAGFVESRDMFMGKKRCVERARTWVGEDGLLDSIALEGCQEQFARQIMITIRKKKKKIHNSSSPGEKCVFLGRR